MISEAIDFSYLLLENYKKMNLDENELATLFMMEHLINQGNPFITADLLSLKMHLNVHEIDGVLASLLTRGFIEYKKVENKTVTTLDPLKSRLYREFQLALSKEEQRKTSQNVEKQLNNIYSEFDKLLGRQLTPIEINKIREWVSYGYSDETIINALKDTLARGKKSLRSVDKTLLKWSARDDIEKEGLTTLSEKWEKNLEETIAIAKTPWLDIDEDDENK